MKTLPLMGIILVKLFAHINGHQTFIILLTTNVTNTKVYWHRNPSPQLSLHYLKIQSFLFDNRGCKKTSNIRPISRSRLFKIRDLVRLETATASPQYHELPTHSNLLKVDVKINCLLQYNGLKETRRGSRRAGRSRDLVICISKLEE